MRNIATFVIILTLIGGGSAWGTLIPPVEDVLPAEAPPRPEVVVEAVEVEEPDLQQEQESRLSVPLHDGRLELRQLFGVMCDAASLGEDHPIRSSLESVKISIDLNTERGREQLHAINGLTGAALTVEVDDDRLLVDVDPDFAGRLGEGVEPTLESWRERLAEYTAGGQTGRIGIGLVGEHFQEIPLGDVPRMPKRLVLLVPGLDDPGMVWTDVIPSLQEQGYTVARFVYPPDGSIGDAADLLALNLADLKVAGVQRVDVIGHSMGGLIARDVLTRRAYYGGDGSGSDRLPAIDRLIMVGTPNHGSEMVRLRGLSNFMRLITEENGSIDMVLDGAGDAGIDLLPGSDYLAHLNRRSHPDHTKFTIIAARWITVDQERINDTVARAAELVEAHGDRRWTRWVGKRGHRVASLVNGAIRGVGDGLVTLESTKLEGVDDYVVVEANHLTMLMNPLPNQVVPPSIPIIVERLEE